MLSIYMFQKIRSLFHEGKKKSEIARELNIDRKTVRKYLANNTPPKYSTRVKPTKIDPFHNFETEVLKMLDSDDELMACDIYEFLLEQGYQGSERTIRRKIAEIKGKKPKERFFKQEYTPGEQSQFDFKEKVAIPFVTGDLIVHLHFGTLPYSDIFFIQAYPFRNYQCFIGGFHNFCEVIGGMTENIRIDNLSPCVKKVLKGDKRIYTDSFNAAIEYYDLKVLPCRPGKGNDKGDVERDIRTHARKIKKKIKHGKLVFEDFVELNSWLKEYCEKRWSPQKKEKLDEEKKKFTPLPPSQESILAKTKRVSVNSYGIIHHEGFTLSVPDNLIDTECDVAIGACDIRIYHKNKLVRAHRIDRGEKESILIEDVLPSLIRKPNAMVRWKHKDVLFPDQTFSKFYSQIKTSLECGAEGEFLRCINLLQNSSIQEVRLGMELLLENKSKGYFYEDLKALVLCTKNNDVHQRLEQTPLKPNLSIYDKFIPKGGN